MTQSVKNDMRATDRPFFLSVNHGVEGRSRE
jgi:hypothetical protein